MKIIGLNGSPRRSLSRTGQLVEQILNGFSTMSCRPSELFNGWHYYYKKLLQYSERVHSGS